MQDIMKRNNYNVLSTYALIACLGVVLVLGQMFKLHIHFEHDNNSSNDEHVVNVHVDTSVLHNSLHTLISDNHHEDNLDEGHHADEINISNSSLVKKSVSLNQFVFFFFVISIVISLLFLSRFLRIRYFTSKQSSHYYLFQPPLRAPPVHPA